MADQANAAVGDTLGRSMITSFTTTLPLLFGLLRFGGSTLL